MYIILKKESGVVIAAKFKFNMINVTKSAHDNVLAGRIKVGNSDITVIALYGPQETEKVDIRSEFYEEVGIEVQACVDRGSQPVLVGDLNAKLAFDNNTISSVSPNGSLLKDILSQYSLNALNFSDLCSGKWTRSQSKKGIIEKSIIDYVITNATLTRCLNKLTIDENRLMSPFWIIKTKKSGDLRQYSDHNAFILTFTLPRSRQSNYDINETKSNGWFITPEGLDEFRRKTEMTPLDVIQGDVVHSFDRYMSCLMDSCFKKRQKVKKNHPNIVQDQLVSYKPLCVMVKVIVQHMQKGKTERNIAKGYISYIQDLQNQLIQRKKSLKVAETMAKLTDEHGQLINFGNLRNPFLL